MRDESRFVFVDYNYCGLNLFSSRLEGLTALHPLSPWTYFRRNPGRTLPVAFVIIVAVALVASVVTVVDSIDMTVLTMYGYQRDLTVVTPRNALTLEDATVKAVTENPKTTSYFVARPAFTTVKTIFGKMPFVVFGLNEKARVEVMRRCKLTLASGRMVTEGAAEVMVHSDIARNKHLKLGDIVMEPNSEDSYSSIPAKLVGTYDGPVWLAMTSEQFIKENFPVSLEGLMVFSNSPESLHLLNEELDKSVNKVRCRLWTYEQLVRDTRDALSSLYLIMNLVIGIIIFAIAFLTGMLANIYFMQRIPEFATLAAIGYRRNGLLKRVFAETGILCMVGWIFGSILTILLLNVIRITLMAPRGLLLNPYDFTAYRYTLPLPIAIAFFAVYPIARRLRTMDPVSIIERRQ